jgi:hypothetical protein
MCIDQADLKLSLLSAGVISMHIAMPGHDNFLLDGTLRILPSVVLHVFSFYSLNLF